MPGPSPPGGVVVEVERKPGSFAVIVLGNQALEARVFAEAVAQQVGLGGSHSIGLPLVRGKSADKFQNQRDVSCCRGADRVHGQDFQFTTVH